MANETETECLYKTVVKVDYILIVRKSCILELTVLNYKIVINKEEFKNRGRGSISKVYRGHWSKRALLYCI